MNLITKSALLIAASLALLAPARAGEQIVMQNAKTHATKALDTLKQNATADKGGHRVAAIKHLKAAIAEIEAGIAFDNANVTKSEGKKKKR